FGLLAFSTVLFTYFGVNYFLGGMHSYAGNIALSSLWAIVLVLLALVALVVLAQRRLRKLEEE
ncbi:MAG: hypothetical protein ACK5L5_04235, partial [Bacteroidales bacterium]